MTAHMNSETEHPGSGVHCESGILGETATIRNLRLYLRRIAATDLPVLIQGPTGVGKELVAQALHAWSGRRGRIVAVNTCAIAETMFEDVMFGHVRGAFTGAIRECEGLVAEADGGTLFLDEVSGLSVGGQAKLLRVLETKEFRPLGAQHDRRVEFRVVAATNEDLGRLVAEGRFRGDLAQRLGGLLVSVPSLAQRMADLPLLARSFAERAVSKYGRDIALTECALEALSRYAWPGNVRELKLIVEQLVGLSESATVSRGEVESLLATRNSSESSFQQTVMIDFESRRLVKVMDSVNWDTVQAAALLGVERSTVYRRLRRLGISTKSRPHEWRNDIAGVVDRGIDVQA